MAKHSDAEQSSNVWAVLPGNLGNLEPWVGRRVGPWTGWVDGSWEGWGSRNPGRSTTAILPLPGHPRHNRLEHLQAALVDHSRRRRPFVFAHRPAIGEPRTAVDKGDVMHHGRSSPDGGEPKWLRSTIHTQTHKMLGTHSQSESTKRKQRSLSKKITVPIQTHPVQRKRASGFL